MISWAIIILAAVMLAGFAVMFHAMRHAVDGYEDQDGFHQGAPPWPQIPEFVVISIEDGRNDALNEGSLATQDVEPRAVAHAGH